METGRRLVSKPLSIEELWEASGFTPNDAQRAAITHVEGPLYLPAGPGSGKTRVLLWRALNLMVFHGVQPQEIYLSTFTEKTARQLKEGLQALLGAVTNATGTPFDLSQMYVGTVHSLCQRLLVDRRFSSGRQRPRAPHLLDELGQYFYLYRTPHWRKLLEAVGLDIDEEGSKAITSIFGGDYDSKHDAVVKVTAFFNRLSEECIHAEDGLRILRKRRKSLRQYLSEQGIDAGELETLFRMYGAYRTLLAEGSAVPNTDFSLVQQEGTTGSVRPRPLGRCFVMSSSTSTRTRTRSRSGCSSSWRRATAAFAWSGMTTRRSIGSAGLRWRTLSSFRNGASSTSGWNRCESRCQ